MLKIKIHKFIKYLIFLLVFTSCYQNIVRKVKPVQIDSSDVFYEDTLYINFQGGFDSTDIKIIYNGKDTIQKEMITDDVLGLADIEKKDITEVDSIKVILLEEKQTEINIRNIESNQLGIWYDKTKGCLIYYFQEKPFVYE